MAVADGWPSKVQLAQGGWGGRGGNGVAVSGKQRTCRAAQEVGSSR
jgi:hypothetical protein